MSAEKQNIKDLKELLTLIDNNRKPIAKKLISRMKFMDGTLNKLQTQIKREGAVIEAVNGNGFKTKTEHPAQKSYIAMIGKYNALVKTFSELIPVGNVDNDELLEFLNGGKK